MILLLKKKKRRKIDQAHITHSHIIVVSKAKNTHSGIKFGLEVKGVWRLLGISARAQCNHADVLKNLIATIYDVIKLFNFCAQIFPTSEYQNISPQKQVGPHLHKLRPL